MSGPEPVIRNRRFFQIWRLSSLVLFLIAESESAMGEGLVSMLSTNSVEITSNYTGADIAVFGAIERDSATVARGTPYEIVIAIKGPSAPLVVRQKERVGPIWVNAEQQKFGEIPGFYAILSSGKFEEIVDTQWQFRLKLGLQAITANLDQLPVFKSGQATPKPIEDRFQNALIRLRRDQNLFQENSGTVSFQRANTFRANVLLPANAPLGRYEVTAYLFSGGAFLASEGSGFYVRKIGFEAATASAARVRPLLYGLAAAFMALLSGWLASVIFRRD